MAQDSQSQKMTENVYAAQRPPRKITWKVIFYVAFALAWIAYFVFSFFTTSLPKDWFWECLTFAVSIGGAIVSTIYARQATVSPGVLSLPIVSLAIQSLPAPIAIARETMIKERA